MPKESWRVSQEILRLFQSVGRATLLYDIQDSHSGNMAIRFRDEKGREQIAITASGSQKGDLELDQICFLSPESTDFGYYKASSETDIHARILALPGASASIHAHTKDLMIVTLDDEAKPNQPQPFIPVDPLGYSHLQGVIPVDWVAVPSGSAEMADRIAERLARHPASVIQGHGTFVKASTLKEAFFLAVLANNSGYIVRLMQKARIDVEDLRAKIREDPSLCFSYPPDAYKIEGDECCDFPEEEEILREFRKAGARIFESLLSPFHTGSMSVRGVHDMLYAPKASMPREIGGPLLKVPLAVDENDSRELRLHKELYAGSNFQTIMHCYVPEAEVHAHLALPGQTRPLERIVPIDAEGSFLYLVIPVVSPKVDTDTLIRLLHDYKVVVVRGGGVWGVGMQSLSEVLHHPSSVREICLYRLGALEQGLNLERMEPEKAKRW
jgi:ribulose-5-phosphate 4-epimerase/fuculose-1-phosphate aldolase